MSNTARINVPSGRPWEEEVGYSRAVRVGNVVEVSATCASQPDGTVDEEEGVYEQAKRCFAIIGEALTQAGASFEDVTRNRFYLREFDVWPELARAHREVFGDIRPAVSFVFVAGWPESFVGTKLEIETSAYIGE
jgi:enamine deaminase RidA (YjgF/YER057c/UK114 family)